MFRVLADIINILANILVLLIIVNFVLSLFVNPYHPVRAALERILEPLYAPIRRIVPPVGMFDFSPMILIVLVQILSIALTKFLYSI